MTRGPALRLAVLADNEGCAPGMVCGHGLSVLVEAPGLRILFDTGADGAFLRNASVLGVEASSPDLLFLSHGHWDHAGGVPELLRSGARPRVVLHERFRAPRRAADPGGTFRDVGVSWGDDLLEAAGVPVLRVGDGPVEIAPGVRSTGGIADLCGFPFPPNLQRLGKDGLWETDRFPDEQALVVETGSGVVVVAGCSHAGVGNLLAAVERAAPGRPVRALLGGLHLKGVPPARMVEAAEALARAGVERVYPNHCTGKDGSAALAALLGERVRTGCAGAGFRIDFPS